MSIVKTKGVTMKPTKRQPRAGDFALKTMTGEYILLSMQCDTCHGEGVHDEDEPCGDCEGAGQLVMPDGMTVLRFIERFKN